MHRAPGSQPVSAGSRLTGVSPVSCRGPGCWMVLDGFFTGLMLMSPNVVGVGDGCEDRVSRSFWANEMLNGIAWNATE